MNKAPKERQSRDYQSKESNTLIRHLSKAQEAALAAAVASGKTQVAVEVGSKLIERKVVSKVIVTAPFNNIVEEFPKYSGVKIYSTIENNAQCLIGEIKKYSNIKELSAIIAGKTSAFLSTSHHAMASNHIKKEMDKVNDLSDLLLIIDEAHHCFASDDEEEEKNTDGTKLGEIANIIKAKGGKILYVTATPYRTFKGQTNLIFNPSECKSVIRTIGEQMRESLGGKYDPSVKYAPELTTEYIHVKNFKLTNAGDGGIWDLNNTKIDNPELNRLLPRVIKQWRTEKYPKTILLIPAGNSEINAEKVKKYIENINFPSDVAKLRKRNNPSVLIAVGKSNNTINKLKEDKESNGRKYDIVIGCRKFDEGTDVPSASHMFMVGLPSTVRLFHQRTGRVLRNKHIIEGYSEWYDRQWMDKAKVIFFAPVGRKTKDFDYKVGRQLLHCIFAGELYQEYCESPNTLQKIRFKLEDKYKTANNNETKEMLDELMDYQISAELYENKDYSSNKYNELQSDKLNPDMTVRECIENIKDDVTDRERYVKISNLLNIVADNKKIDIDIESIVNHIIRKSKSKRTNERGFNVAPTVFFDAIESILQDFCDEKVNLTISEGVESVFSKITGESSFDWAEKCNQYMGEEADQMWTKRICDFKDKHGKNPSQRSEDPIEKRLGDKLSSLRAKLNK